MAVAPRPGVEPLIRRDLLLRHTAYGTQGRQLHELRRPTPLPVGRNTRIGEIQRVAPFARHATANRNPRQTTTQRLRLRTGNLGDPSGVRPHISFDNHRDQPRRSHRHQRSRRRGHPINRSHRQRRGGPRDHGRTARDRRLPRKRRHRRHRAVTGAPAGSLTRRRTNRRLPRTPAAAPGTVAHRLLLASPPSQKLSAAKTTLRRKPETVKQ